MSVRSYLVNIYEGNVEASNRYVPMQLLVQFSSMFQCLLGVIQCFQILYCVQVKQILTLHLDIIYNYSGDQVYKTIQKCGTINMDLAINYRANMALFQIEIIKMLQIILTAATQQWQVPQTLVQQAKQGSNVYRSNAAYFLFVLSLESLFTPLKLPAYTHQTSRIKTTACCRLLSFRKI